MINSLFHWLASSITHAIYHGRGYDTLYLLYLTESGLGTILCIYFSVSGVRRRGRTSVSRNATEKDESTSIFQRVEVSLTGIHA
jgi:hypothetical protein